MERSNKDSQTSITQCLVNFNDKGMAALEIYWLVGKKSVELNNFVYFKDVLTSEWKLDMCYIGEEVFRLLGEAKCWISSRFIKINSNRREFLNKETR